MEHGADIEIAAALAGDRAAARRHAHAPPAGSSCYNCGAKLLGPWCHDCGQRAEDFHRSAWHLLGEAIEGLTHADGRVWRTLPPLLFRPATLTQAYLAGKRASQVPPLRLFLVVLLLVFVSGELASRLGGVQFFKVEGDLRKAPEIESLQLSLGTPWDAALGAWLRTHLSRALQNPDRLLEAMAGWGHDFAFLMLPVSAALLAMLFVFRRRFVLFDHLIFSMHSLAFQGLLFVAWVAADAVIGSAAALLFLLSPLHLYVHLRGVYGLGRTGALVRMSFLFIGTCLGVGLLVAGLLGVGLASV